MAGSRSIFFGSTLKTDADMLATARCAKPNEFFEGKARCGGEGG
jgi:hypothetical protein